MWGPASIYNRGFSETFRCYPVSALPGNERENVMYGGKSMSFLLILFILVIP